MTMIDSRESSSSADERRRSDLLRCVDCFDIAASRRRDGTWGGFFTRNGR